jgi:formimidoylglutamate deiminase
VKLRFERALLTDGVHRDVAVEVGPDGRFAAVGAPTGGERSMRGLALPGMPNLHSHAFQRAMAGSAEVASGTEHSFWGWREVMYRFVERLAPEDLTAIAAFAYLEMLEAGYTSVAEFHYLHHAPAGVAYAESTTLADAVRQGARLAGIRHLLLPALYQQGNFHGERLEGAQRRFAHSTESFLRLHERLQARESGVESTGVALHSLRAVPRAALEAVATAVRTTARPCPVHIHVAEQRREVSDCQSASGARPVDYLLSTGLVSDRWCLVHATHVTTVELDGIARSGAVVGLCPTTECNLGDGHFPLDELLAVRGRFGVGSDSHVSLDPREELRLLEYLLRAWRERRVIAVGADVPHCGAFLYGAAVAGGAQACGATVSGLLVGAPADFVVIDTDRPASPTRHCSMPGYSPHGRARRARCGWRARRSSPMGGTARARPSRRSIARASHGWCRNEHVSAAPVPLYEQVKHHVLRRIRSGEWGPGARVQSEHELVRELSVSRMTANRAIRELVQSGVLSRVAGSGTFVADLRSAGHPLQIRSIATEIRDRGHAHRADVVAVERVVAPAEIRARLKLRARHVFRSIVVHHENGVPLQLEERYVDPAVAPGYLSVDFRAVTAHEYLMDVAPLERVEHVVKAVVPAPRVAKLLALAGQEAVLLIERTTWSRGRHASFALLHHAGSRFELRGVFDL